MKITSKINSLISSLFNLISRLIIKLFYLLELLLFFRLILIFFGANEKTLVVKQIFKLSDFFVNPFESIFPNIYWAKNYFIETSTLVAMLGYAILVYIILRLLQSFSRD